MLSSPLLLYQCCCKARPLSHSRWGALQIVFIFVILMESKLERQREGEKKGEGGREEEREREKWRGERWGESSGGVAGIQRPTRL